MLNGAENQRIAITGFMGVGKSTVSRHLARITKSNWVDLDLEIEKAEGRSVAEIVDGDGIERFRTLESEALKKSLSDESVAIISLGGGTFMDEANRSAISATGVTSVWLEAGFEHSWANIRTSYKDRPLARNRESAYRLYQERLQFYCLADWHFLIKPGCNSVDVAEQIAEQIFGYRH